MPRRKPSRREPLEIEMWEDPYGPTNANTHHGRLRLDHGERYLFRIGDSEVDAVVLNEAGRLLNPPYSTKPGPNVACREWIREMQRVDRLLSHGVRGVGGSADVSVSSPGRRHRIVKIAVRRHTEIPSRYRLRHRDASRSGANLPISLVAVCVGGTHCAAVELPADCTLDCRGPREFPPSMRAFLSEPCLSFAGVGVACDAARLREDWDVPLANPRELRWPVSRAFRDEYLRGEFGWKGKEGLAAMAWVVLDGVVVGEEP